MLFTLVKSLQQVSIAANNIKNIVPIGQKNQDGLTACDFAERANHKSLAELLSWKNPFLFPAGTLPEFANPQQLNSSLDLLMEDDEEKAVVVMNTNVKERGDSSYYSGSITLSSDESLKNSPVAALQPGPVRRYRVQSTDIGIEPIPFITSSSTGKIKARQNYSVSS